MWKGSGGVVMRLETVNHRFAEEILNAKFDLKREIHETLKNVHLDTHKHAHEALKQAFIARGWNDEEPIAEGLRSRYDLYKNRIAIEVETSHRTNTYKDLLKFLVGFNENKIDVGVEVLWSDEFKKRHRLNPGAPSLGILSSDLEMFRLIVPVPVYGIGIDEG